MAQQSEYFWTIIIEKGATAAAIWTREGEETKVLSIGQPIATDGDDLTTSIDAALTSAVGELDLDPLPEPSKTVFGLPPTWIEDGKISSQYLGLIKEVSEKLSLTPIGFVILPEALAHEMKHADGSPMTGAFLGIDKQNLDVTLFRLGNPAGTVSVARSVHLFEDVLEGLARFKSHNEPMPTRIILYGAHEGELIEARDTLSLAEWNKNEFDITFLHTPQISIADTTKKCIAVSYSASTELGDVKMLIIPDQDEPEIDEDTEDDNDELTNLGFVSEQDIENITAVSDEEGHSVTQNESHVVQSHRNPVQKGVGKLTHLFAGIGNKLPFRHEGSTHHPIHIHKPEARHVPHMRRLIGGNKKISLIAIVPVLILIVLVALWVFIPRAEVLVYVAPRNLTDSLTLTFDSTITEVKEDENKIPTRTLTQTVSGEKTQAASGTKTVGDRSKGTVTIRNGTSLPVKLSSGAVLATNKDLKFTLDQSASVSAATSPTTPGTQTVNVTASSIGADSNLASGEALKVSNYPTSEVDAVVEAALSGGSSREVSAVSKSDIDSLTSAVTESVTQDAKTSLMAQLTGNEIFIDSSLTSQIAKKTSSAKVGDESQNITMSLEVTATGLAVSRDNLQKLSANLLSGQVPSGFTLRPEQIEVRIENISAQGSVYTARGTATANLLPDTNPDEIINKIAGKRTGVITDALKTVPGFVKAEVTTTPVLPTFLKLVPFIKNHISVEVVSAR